MTEQSSISALAEALLTKYDFDLGCETSEQLIARWQNNYQVEWLTLAVVEALYLGRYKAISVEQILTLWKRRSQPVYHFNSEFQNIITRNILTNLISQTDTQPLEANTNPTVSESKLSEQSTSISPPSNPFEPNSHNKDQELVEQIPVKPTQYKLKHTDFYTKLKKVVKNSQALRSPPKELEQENEK
jgi:hypothetical protein